MRVAMIAWVMVVGTGCAEVAGEAVARQALVSDPCDKEWKCGGNSPVMGARGFHDLSLSPQANEAGLTIHRTAGVPAITVGRAVYQLVVQDSQIIARSGATDLTGTALIGATITLDADGAPQFALRIDGARPMVFPFPLGSAEPLTAYTLSWRALAGGTYVNLCANPPVDLLNLPAEQSFPELLGLQPPEAVVFAGDRIDAAAKTMSAMPDPAWFNIGCAGHTVAKLHLTRNTIASQHAADPTLLRTSRQATLKLLVADYCGTGRSFTVPGQPLQWKGGAGDPRDAYFRGVAIDGIEARWTADGAICLSTPRMAVSRLPLAKQLYPDVVSDIHAECAPLPPCLPDDPAVLAGAPRISANPVP